MLFFILLMERGDLMQSPSVVLHKIKEFIRAFIIDLSYNHCPLVAIDHYRSFCSNTSGNCFCGSDLPNGVDFLSLKKEGHVCRLRIILRVLMIIQQLLQENKHGSKRDIYYTEPSIFTDQAVVNRAINDICILLKCSRHHLNVVPVGRGLVMGWLRFVEGGRRISCITSPNTAYMIPICVEEVEDIVSVAQYILVVEKETVFQRLANDKFCERHHCIVITGRGYPDVPTRRFLQLLVKTLRLPAYCLVDFDPYGFDILTVYRFGSLEMAYDTEVMRVSELRWLGAFYSDFEKFQLPERCLLSLTTEDKKKAEAMLSRCYLHQQVPHWRLELEKMLHEGAKFEIEALSASSFSFLAETYIPLKIQGGDFI